MTEEQANQQLQLIASMYSQGTDTALVSHQLLGTTLFLSHVVAGILFLVLMFGLILASQMRKKG